MSTVATRTDSSKGWTTLVLFLAYFVIRHNYELVHYYYAYTGIDYVPSTERFLISFVSIIYCLVYLSFVRLTPLVWTVNGFIFLIINIPFLVFYEFNPHATFGYLLGNFILFHSFLLGELLVPKMSLARFSPKMTSQILYFVVPLMLVPFLMAYGIDLNFNVFLLQEIYDVRFEAREKSTFLTSYFYSWLSRVLIPVMVVYGIKKRDLVLLALGVIIILYLFLTAARKSVYFSLFLVFFFYYIKGFERKLLYFTILLICLLLLGSYFNAIGADKLCLLVTSIISFRFLFVPIEVSVNYFEFFEGNPMYWSYSFFNPFVDYPYELTPPHLIGLVYYNFAEMSANTGIIADGFMNMGLMGVLVNSLLFGGTVVFISRMKLSASYFGVFFVFFTAAQNSSMLTILLTHGLFVFIIVSIFFDINDPAKS